MSNLLLISIHLQHGEKVGLQLFVWKIIQQLINNNTRINCVLHTHNSKPPFVCPVFMFFIYSLKILLRTYYIPSMSADAKSLEVNNTTSSLCFHRSYQRKKYTTLKIIQQLNNCEKCSEYLEDSMSACSRRPNLLISGNPLLKK